MDANPKQQIAEKLKESNNVLVTVNDSPSVDELSAALGLALMLESLEKHSTAVFSGKIPTTMRFLDPVSTFKNNVDGLRDFIISLKKDKADKLRYKVEDDSNTVKIFITPLKDAITQKDLKYSQGDYNVDMVVALGVGKREHLDKAITSHGRILHDATIVTINAGKNTPQNGFGSINWTDTNASCLSEMLVSISESLQGGIIDGPISTALLTGIVSATERFKNENTTPKVMTMAAQLMAAGANQQKIANNLNFSDKTAPTKNVQPQNKKQPTKQNAANTATSQNSADASSDDAGSPSKGWSFDVDDPESGKGLPNEEDKRDAELLANIKGINKPSSAKPKLEPSARTRKSVGRDVRIDPVEDRPSIEEAAFNSTSAEVERMNLLSRVDASKGAAASGVAAQSATPSATDDTVGDKAQQTVSVAADVLQPTKADPEVEVTTDAPPAEESVEDARRAVEAAVAADFKPDNNPTESINAVGVPMEQDVVTAESAPDSVDENSFVEQPPSNELSVPVPPPVGAPPMPNSNPFAGAEPVADAQVSNPNEDAAPVVAPAPNPTDFAIPGAPVAPTNPETLVLDTGLQQPGSSPLPPPPPPPAPPPAVG